MIHQSLVFVFDKCGWARIPARGNKVSHGIKNSSCTTSPPVTHKYVPVWCNWSAYILPITTPSPYSLFHVMFIKSPSWDFLPQFIMQTLKMSSVIVLSLMQAILYLFWSNNIVWITLLSIKITVFDCCFSLFLILHPLSASFHPLCKWGLLIPSLFLFSALFLYCVARLAGSL